MNNQEEMIEYSSSGEAAINANEISSPFAMPRDAKTVSGLLLIAASYIFCWPLIGILGGISAYLHRPSIVAIGGPLVYGFSYILLFGGLYLAGKKYAALFYKRIGSIANRFLMFG